MSVELVPLLPSITINETEQESYCREHVPEKKGSEADYYDICFVFFANTEDSDARNSHPIKLISRRSAEKILANVCNQSRRLSALKVQQLDFPLDIVINDREIQKHKNKENSYVYEKLEANESIDSESSGTTESDEEKLGLSNDDRMTQNTLYKQIRKSFIKFLAKIGCDIKKTRRGNFIFYCVRLGEEGVKALAFKSRYTLQMDSSTGEQYGFRQYTPPHLAYDYGAEYAVSALSHSIELNPNSSLRSQTQNKRLVWQRYDEIGRPVSVTVETKDDKQFTIFRSVDRIRLLLSQISHYYNLEMLVQHRILASYYVLHQQSMLQFLKDNWGSYQLLTKGNSQPIEEIRTYFGENITFYFVWLGFFTERLLIPGIIGLVVFVIQYIWDSKGAFENSISNIASISYAIYITCWSVFFLNQWQREETRYKLKWGVDEVLSQAQRKERHRFKQKHSEGLLQTGRCVISLLASFIYVTFVVGVVCYLFSLPLLVQKYPEYFSFISYRVPVIVATINVIFISVFDYIWCSFASTLTEFENWRFEEEYHQSLVLKLFIFRFINYFNSFFYLAWVKDYIDPCSPRKSCVGLLKWNLGLIFLVNFSMNLFEVGCPAISYYIRRHKICRKMEIQKSRNSGAFRMQQRLELEKKIDKAVEKPDIFSCINETAIIHLEQTTFGAANEAELLLSDYDAANGLDEDYMEMILEFGFVTLFSIILPVVPFLAYISNVFEIRSDAFKLLRLHRRPYPAKGVGLGPWNEMLFTMICIAVAVNVGISVFTIGLTPGKPMPLLHKFVIFIVAEHLGILAPSILSYVLPKETRETQICREAMNRVLYNTIWGEMTAEASITTAYENLSQDFKQNNPNLHKREASKHYSL